MRNDLPVKSGVQCGGPYRDVICGFPRELSRDNNEMASL